MRISLIILIFHILPLSLYQEELDCSCEAKKYDCDILEFENGAKLYWQRNCDSAWLTFENENKIILKTCKDELFESCQKTGLNFLKEYPSYLLFQYRWVSGCCQPPDVVFISEVTGREINRVYSSQFVWGDIGDNYLLYFSDTTYTELIFLNHITEKKKSSYFDPDLVLSSTKANDVLSINSLFKDFELIENELIFSFKLDDGRWETKKICIE